MLAEKPMEQRMARFRCVVALVEVPDQPPVPPPRLFEGKCEGRIAFAPRGDKGFGYDPLFMPEGYDESFGQLGEAAKNQLSHRARALKRLGDYLRCLQPVATV
jgi:XTP/dITP diphosphohydrolase